MTGLLQNHWSEDGGITTYLQELPFDRTTLVTWVILGCGVQQMR